MHESAESTGLRNLPSFAYKLFARKSVFALSAVMLMLYIFRSSIHTETYIWQCTTLADTVMPVDRKSCPAVVRNDPPIPDGKLKIGLIIIYDPNYGLPDKHLAPRIINNRKNYCKRHGCTVISKIVSRTPVNNRPPAWAKLTTMLEQLKTDKYDYVWYMDMDMIIMNSYLSPEYFVNQGRRDSDIVITHDFSGVNTGVMLARNSNFSQWFLQTAYDQEQLVKPYAKNGVPYIFEFEQRAFHYLLDTPQWRARDVPRYPGNSTALLQHFTILEQCSMNSYFMHPLEYRGDREESHYVKGDFLVHMAGKKDQIKIDSINYFLSLAEREYEL
jgi:hypothetical protein